MTKQKTKKKEILKENLRRVPRPVGTTMRAMAYQGTQDPQEKQRIKEELLQWTLDQYATNGMMLNNRIMNLDELANYLNMPIERTLLKLNRTIEKVTNILKGADGAQLARGVYMQAIKKSLEIQALTQSQANMLLAKQGGEYVPFLSSTANQALKNLMDSQKPIMELLKMYMDNTKIAGMAGVPEEGNLPSHNTYFDTDQAINMINQNTKSILQDSHLLEAKASSLDMPEVQANKQDLSSIGIKQMVPKDTAYLEPETRERVPKATNTHDTRREASMGIDEVLDADDFKV